MSLFFLIAILDCVDDTKLTAKAILGELTASDDVLDDIIQDDRARKVFLYAMVSKFVEQFFLFK